MPGNVQASPATTVLPDGLYIALTEGIEYALIGNEYRGGESQRQVLVGSGRRRWRFTRRLTPTQMAVLEAFYLARRGGTEAFYFYNPHETDPLFSYDETGVDETGRYKVRFEGPAEITFGNTARSNLPLEIVECA